MIISVTRTSYKYLRQRKTSVLLIPPCHWVQWLRFTHLVNLAYIFGVTLLHLQVLLPCSCTAAVVYTNYRSSEEQIIPDFVYGSSAESASLEDHERMRGQSRGLPSIEKEERPAFAPEQAEGRLSGVGLHSATQARQVKGNAKPSSGGDQPTVTPLFVWGATESRRICAEYSPPPNIRRTCRIFWGGV
eukprot:SAG11_NODE_2826_length_2937_cov_1.313953_1_plen_188_part_00